MVSTSPHFEPSQALPNTPTHNSRLNEGELPLLKWSQGQQKSVQKRQSNALCKWFAWVHLLFILMFFPIHLDRWHDIEAVPHRHAEWLAGLDEWLAGLGAVPPSPSGASGGLGRRPCAQTSVGHRRIVWKKKRQERFFAKNVKRKTHCLLSTSKVLPGLSSNSLKQGRRIIKLYQIHMEPTNCEFSLLVRTRGHVYVDLLRRSITWMFHEDF